MSAEDQFLDVADNLFEEVEPVAVLKARKNENGTRDFLVKWSDGSEDAWVCALHPFIEVPLQALIPMHPFMIGSPLPCSLNPMGIAFQLTVF